MTLNKYYLDKDINVFCLLAKSFPDDVSATHDKLHELLLPDENRRYFGISQPESAGEIIYKAAAEVLAIDAIENYKLEIFTIKKGEYISTFIEDYYLDIPSVGKAFMELLRYPAIDYNSYCLEMYSNVGRDLLCMVKINELKS